MRSTLKESQLVGPKNVSRPSDSIDAKYLSESARMRLMLAPRAESETGGGLYALATRTGRSGSCSAGGLGAWLCVVVWPEFDSSRLLRLELYNA
jgi:hypothetical protein